MRGLFILILAIPIFASAGDYYVDAQNGSDTTGDGSQSNPWQTIQHAFDNVSAYDGDGADTLHLTGGVDADATAQSNDNEICIISESGDIRDGDLDITNTENAYIVVDYYNDVTLLLGEASTVDGGYGDSEYPPGPQLTIEANDKNNITIEYFGYYGEFVGYIYIYITDGSGHQVSNNYVLHFIIDFDGVSDSIIYDNTSGFPGSSGPFTDDSIICTDSEVEITGNSYFNISATGDPDIHHNSYGQMNINNVPPLSINNNSLHPPSYYDSDEIGIDFDLPNGVLCNFHDNTAYISETSFGYVFDEGPWFNINSGDILIRDCTFHYEWNEFRNGTPGRSPLYSYKSFIDIKGGIADLGGGPLSGSPGGNTFETIDWDPDYPSYLIINSTPDDVYALGNTWDSETTTEMAGHFYDTYNVTKIYDKWDDPSLGYVIWSEPDPQEPPLGDFSLLLPPNGSTVNTLRPTLDWEDAQPAKWRFPETLLSTGKSLKGAPGNKRKSDAAKRGKSVTLDHYELYYDTDAGYSNPTVINDLTESTYTFDYDLVDGETYYWKVKAVDSLNRELWCNELGWWFLVDLPEGVKSASLGEIKARFR